jgi:hypothetical protein
VTHLEAGCALCGEINVLGACARGRRVCVGGGLWLRLEALVGWRISASLLNPLPEPKP